MIVQYWDSEEIPTEVAALMATFAEHNPELPRRVFDEHAAAALIGERFGERFLAAFRACSVPAMQADYFRYCAVHALGGVYVDADLRCVGPLRPLLAHPASGTLFGRPELPRRWRTPAFEWGERVGAYRVVVNSLFAFPAPGHPLLELAIEVATANVERRVDGEVWLVTGPAIFTSLYLLHELGSFDAFGAYVQGGALAAIAPILEAAIGDQRRVVEAFRGVRLPPAGEAAGMVGDERELHYKAGERHWLNVESGIYR
jgi:Glycosyltransferase sugar-binding region containing DXD motif